ncbi:uncharacterized protein LOC129587811 [Paramacrobiotus metropolitanus]|uniref:uncharacterized protein LOC129587811 n=1 Tax=Paramacrobiotus metropolitanus TaxID=2943436 RepID=UPI002445E447|nr:uncharacterized protein LOC129587811 [Paramacrobiotus metropolitanus]
MLHVELVNLSSKILDGKQLAALIDYPLKSNDPLLIDTSARCPCGSPHPQALLSFQSVAAFILNQVSLPQLNSDAVLQYLSLSVQLCHFACSIREKLRQSDLHILSIFYTRLSVLFLHKQLPLCTEELFQDCLIQNFVLFPKEMTAFAANSEVSLRVRLQVAARFLRNNPSTPCEEPVQLLAKKLLTESQCGLDTKLAFLVAAAENQHRNSLAAIIDAHSEENDDFLEKCITSDGPLSFNSCLLFLDKFLDYAGEMYTLNKNVESFTGIASWISQHSSIIFSPKSIELVKQTTLVPVSSCVCVEIRKLVSVLLKAVCICVRQMDRKEIGEDLINLCSACPEHPNASFPSFLCTVFARDDEGLCESLLCMLHLHVLLPADKNIPSPELCFQALLAMVADDHFVFVSWIVDNQTCFLAYLVQYVKYLNEKTVSQREKDVFGKIMQSLTALAADGKVPFDVEPLTRRLRQVLLQSEKEEQI